MEQEQGRDNGIDDQPFNPEEGAEEVVSDEQEWRTLAEELLWRLDLLGWKVEPALPRVKPEKDFEPPTPSGLAPMRRYMVAATDREFYSWLTQGRHVIVPVREGVHFGLDADGIVSVRAEIISRSGGQLYTKVVSAMMDDGTKTSFGGMGPNLTVTLDHVLAVICV